ncbi:cell wall hydrolase [Paenibacillus agri]|uniref:Cell wall hydrolase n=1 Tax=Paenibacillus agri TaxID=2744309 RepID=A0A850EQK6_9BACL|nr:cell wall hydrolase [Paenibacillus agri]NUU63523.1 cell wall hydrolase [Paenibacillus agri]
MVIYKQNRYIALLIGVILVSFSAINLLHPEPTTEGKLTKVQGKLSAPPVTSALELAPKTTDSNHTRIQIQSTIHPVISSAVIQPKPEWSLQQKAEWLNRQTIAAADTVKTAVVKEAAVKTKAAAVPVTPAVQHTLQKTATASKGSQTEAKKVAATQQHPPIILYFSRTELLSQEQKDKATWRYTVSGEDLLLLQKIVMAEAEGEPYKGKVAVANVVLNRLRSAKFPDTMHKVIYQKRQFSPVANGRLNRVKPNEDCIKAVNAALSGIKEVADDTYFFLSLKLAQDLTVHHTQKYVKTIGNHTFYK